MKKIIQFMFLLFASLFSLRGRAQDKNIPLAPVLLKYYDLKNALVAGDVSKTAATAKEFSAALKAVNTKNLNAEELSAFNSVQSSLVTEAGSIEKSKQLEKQRTIFQSFSTHFITLAKAARLAKPAYVDYCPMKQAYWISEEKAIKNPYYGAMMLNCGKVSDTLQ